MKNLIIILIVLMVSACASTGSKPADKTYYRFPEATQTTINKNLIIEKPTAMGILANRPMVVQGVNGGLTQMSHNFWIDSPKVLLHNYLNKTFNNNQSVDNKKLHTQILSLEKKGNNAFLSIKFRITDKDKKEVFNKTYTEKNKLEQNTIPAFVNSISDSIETLVKQFIGDID